MLYARIVRRTLTEAFAGLSHGHQEAVTDKFTSNVEHYFVGHHALSGKRTTYASAVRWYERLYRIFPDIQFQVRRIDVQGPPWATLATVEWSETNTGTDGVSTSNEGVNIVEIRWGKVRRVHIYTDTERLTKTLNRLAASGNAEAQAEPIVDP